MFAAHVQSRKDGARGQFKRGVGVKIPWCTLRCKEKKRGRGQTMSQCGEAPEFKVWASTQKHNRAAHAETSFHPLTRPAGGEAEWPTRRDIWAEGSQVDFISAPFKSNLIGVGRSGRSCEGGGKKGRRGRIWKLLNVLFIWEWLLGEKLEDRSPDFLFSSPTPHSFPFFFRLFVLRV